MTHVIVNRGNFKLLDQMERYNGTFTDNNPVALERLQLVNGQSTIPRERYHHERPLYLPV